MSHHLQRTWEEVWRVYTQSLFGSPFMLNWLWMTETIYADHFYIQSGLQSAYLPAAPHSDKLFLLSAQHSFSCVSCGWSSRTALITKLGLITVLDYCDLQEKCIPKVASSKNKANCTELFAFETSSNCWYTPMLTAALICCPNTVWVCAREQSVLGMLFHLEQWAAFWKVTVSVLPLAPRLLHPTSRCPTMQLRVRQCPPHYSLH